MDYSDVVASQGKLIEEWNIGDYQGDLVYLLKNEDQYGFTVVGYGSCSVCDSLQACEDEADFEILKESIINDIKWGTKKEIYDYIFSEEANRWYFYEEQWEEIKKDIKEILA